MPVITQWISRDLTDPRPARNPLTAIRRSGLLSTDGMGEGSSRGELLGGTLVAGPRIELGTRGFSVHCSTD